MHSVDELLKQLMEFGLNEREARLYVCLLKNGASTVAKLTKSLGTYRVDVHRTLESVIDKGLVEALLDAPPMYVAVPIREAVNSALEVRMDEYRRMQQMTRELVEIVERIHFEPTEEVSKFRLVRSVTRARTVTSQMVKAAQKDVIFITTPYVVNTIVEFGSLVDYKNAAKRTVSVRCVTNISERNLDAVLDARSYLEIRHYSDYQGIRFLAVDNRESFMALDCDVLQSESDLHNIWLWSDNTDFAERLRATFEILWIQSDSTEERMHEILTEAPTV
jgi:sugar-specific transcriptional regulator TrmB